MLIVKKEGILIDKTNLGFEDEGVLNPAVIKEDNVIHLFYRAVSKGNFSSIGYCKMEGPLKVTSRMEVPLLYPQFDYESQGMEDPRIVKIDELYYLTYTAYDGINALGALATSRDLKTFDKHGIIVPRMTYEEFNHLSRVKGVLNGKYARYNEHDRILENHERKQYLWDKNVIFFPRRLHGKLCFLHRIKPDVQVVVAIDEIADLTPTFWEQYFLEFDKYIVLKPKYAHEVSYIGGGCPPIETPYGWILIYHGVHDTTKGYVYSACAALLDLEDPRIEISRLDYPLFFPEMSWELKGEVNNVCFPTGAVQYGDTLYIYYGAADEHIAVASLSMTSLLTELHTKSKQNES